MPIGGAVTNFPQGFASGLQVRGMPLLQMQPAVAQAAAALFCGWFAFQFQGSRSAILLAG